MPKATCSLSIARRFSTLGIAIGLATIASAAVPQPQAVEEDRLAQPTEIPTEGAVPPVVNPELLKSVRDMALAAEYGPYRRQLRAHARRYLGNRRDPAIRAQGLEGLREYTDTGALFAMPFALDNQKEDVRTAVLDHLANSGSTGQAALAWAAIHHEDESMRTAAISRITEVSDPLVLAVIESGLRDSRHSVVNAAGALAGAIDAFQTIPLLIFSQYSSDPVDKQGDLAWIAIGTQQSYVQNLIPVTGNGVGAFQPVIGTITEGFVMRVSDAVAIVYRTEVHYSLVRLADAAYGGSTEHLGWDMNRWRKWYNTEYLPKYRADAAEAALHRDAQEIARREKARAENSD
jgi:hypothetical protein